MPFVSKAQIRKFYELHKQGKISTAKLNEFTRATPNASHLPERVGKAKKSSTDKKNLAIKGLI